MAINTEIVAKNNESGTSVLRRFSRRAKSSGVVRKAKSLRYYNRKISRTMQKNQKIRSEKKLKQMEKMIKMGKLKDTRRKNDILREN